MKVGVSLFIANYTDWERYEAKATDTPPAKPDSEVYAEALRLGDLIEPLGYDSIWSVEHRTTPYLMIPNPVQLLTYFAARTERVDFGTMVIVLPWHDPVLVAEEIAMLDNILQGRRLTLGFGRGASRREFEALRVSMSETRGRFDEALEIIRKALTQERFAHEGTFYTIPETNVRPRPRSLDLVQRMHIAWMSPETLPIGAQAGLGMLFTNSKSWAEYEDDVKNFNAIRAQREWQPIQPIVVAFVSCAETETEAWTTARTYMGEQQNAVRRHYEFEEPEHFRQAGSYDHYAGLAQRIAGSTYDELNENYAKAQVWGTPEQCFERLKVIQSQTSAAEFVLVFNYGSMPYDVAEKNLRLFAEEVLPRLHSFEPSAFAGVAAGD